MGRLPPAALHWAQRYLDLAWPLGGWQQVGGYGEQCPLDQGHHMESVPSAVRANARERWLILAVLFLARTAMGFQFQAVAALSSFIAADLKIDYARLGLLIGLYLLPGVAIAYPGGLLGQYFGDKRIAVFGMALMVAGGLVTAIADDFAIVAAGRLVSGGGAVLVNVLLTTMLTD